MQMAQQDPRPSAWQLFCIWASIGLQSFGGGASTTFLIQHEFIDKHGWLTMEEFVRYWNLCVFTPGINLVALTVLLGRKLGGAWGVAVSLAGMLLPSAAITCLLAAGFRMIQNIPAVQACVRGIIPATAGIMLLVGLRFAQPLTQAALKEGAARLIVSLIMVLACATAMIVLKLPVILVLPVAALLGVVFFTPSRQAFKESQEEKE
jgi:chromate transporter